MAYLRKGFNLFDIFNYALMFVLGIITLYPFIYVLTISLVPTDVYIQGGMFLYPKKISFEAYKIVFTDRFIYSALYSSAVITVAGTIVNLAMNSMAAYAFSKRDLKGNKVIMRLFVFTMYFSGGLIPSYLLMNSLHLIDTYWAVILTWAVSCYNILVMRTFFTGIPASLEESALIDGASDITVFIKIILPLSKPILAALGLFFAVGHWNDYFTPMIYLNSRDKWPLQIVLREILFETTSSVKGSMEENGSTGVKVVAPLRMAIVIVSMVPITLVYPFLQKHFVKGVLIGAVKA